MKINRNVDIDPKKDLYAELGIALNGRNPSDIPAKEIEEAVKSMRRLHHPDKHQGLSPDQLAGKERRMQAIEEAKDVLLGQKEEYDRQRAEYKTNSTSKANHASQGEERAAENKGKPKADFNSRGEAGKAGNFAKTDAMGTFKRYAKTAAGAVGNIADNFAKSGAVAALGRVGGFIRGLTPGGWVATGVMAGATMAYDMYRGGEAEAKASPDSGSSSAIANPPKEHKVEPVPEQPEHKALREKRQLEADKKKLEAEKAEFEAQKKAQQGTIGAPPAPDGAIAKHTATGEDSVREVQKGDTLSKIADSRDADMKKARAQVREALGGNADNKTVLSVLAIALAENNGKENIHHIEVGDKLSISGDKIKQVVAELKEAGKLEGGRLALGNETTLTEIFARAPNTPNNNQQVASAGK